MQRPKRYELTPEQWHRIKDVLPGKPGDPGRSGNDNLTFVNGVLWVLRSGAHWHDLPERYGPHTTAYNRYNRWAKAGIWLRVFEALAAASPQSMQLIDSSIVCAHQHAAGGKRGARITPSAVLVED